MEKAMKIVLGLICIPLLVLGFGTIVNPEAFLEKWGVVAQDANGLNTIRGIIGGLLAGTGVMIAIGLWKNNTTWLLATAALMAVVVFGRLLGIVLDGFHPAVVGPTVVEIIIIVLAIALDRRAQVP